MTIQEHFGSTSDLRVAWVGDGNNVCNSLILSTVLTGLNVTVATPPGYEPADEIVKKAHTLGGKVTLVRKPEQAVKDADVIVTDTWISMGDDAEREERLKVFRDYTVDASLMRHSSPDARVPSVFRHTAARKLPMKLWKVARALSGTKRKSVFTHKKRSWSGY